MLTRLIRSRGRRLAPRLAVVGSLIAASLLPARDLRAQLPVLRVSTSAGYDDNVLGRPGLLQDFPVLKEAFLRVSPSLEEWYEPGSWRLGFSYTYVLNEYGSAEAGLYRSHVGGLSVSRRFSSRLSMAVESSAEQYRRSEFHDFDLDRIEVAPRIEWTFSPLWTARLTYDASRWRYPGRQVTPGGTAAPSTEDPLRSSAAQAATTGSPQTDTPAELEVGITWHPDAALKLSASHSRLRTESNQPDFRYDGYRTQFQGEGLVAGGFNVSGGVSYERRQYDRFPPIIVVIPGPDGQILKGDRLDRALTVTLDLNRGVTSFLSAFAEASWLDYTSNARGYGFRETRVSAGLEFRVGGGSRSASSPVAGSASKRSTPAAPAAVVRNGQVRFQCRAPGARQVTLVGSMNGWRTETTPMADADGDGLWEVTLELEPGTYRYMFLVDKTEWRRPEGALLYEADGFGQENGVLVVP